MRPRLLSVLAAAVLAAALGAAPALAAGGTTQVQLLALNDFHGNLEPPGGSSGRIVAEPGAQPVDAGGAAYLASHVRALEAENPNTAVVSAGDLIGGSPLLSALFHDEPTIESMNRLGLDLNAVGNHEFDEGAAELRRMQEGGCHPTDGCQDGDGFEGADFRFLAANVVGARTGRPFFRPYAIRRFGRQRVGFIGMTLEATPDIVSAAGIQGLRFLDEAETANRYARVLRERHGVQTIVVLLHQGGTQTGTSFGINTCEGIAGPVVDIVNRTDDEVDLFITGHTHQAYNCVIDGRPVTSASSFGRLVTDIDMTLTRRGEVRQVKANNEVVTRDVEPAADIAELVQRYKTLAAPLEGRVIGRVAGDLTRAADDSGESAAGNVIADAQLAATSAPERGGAVAAFMNPGGVRADLAGGEVTYGEAFTVQPFGNTLTTLTLTGAQLLDVLKQQWCGQGFARILIPSSTVSYTWDASVAAEILGKPCEGAANPVSELTIGGTPVDSGASYRITVNSFLADGGDAFSVLTQGTDRLGGVVDVDAFEAYLAGSLTGEPLAIPALDRITVVP